MNRFDFRPLEPTPRNYFDEQSPKVSICIPARNEANSIARCVRSAAEQEYKNCHVYVLDDESTDGTSEILAKISTEFPETVSVLSGTPKPHHWLGKAWACHQLSEAASGDILLFIDADTWLEPNAVAKVVRTMGRHVVDMITLWPDQHLGTFWEKTVVPLVYFALLTLLPTRLVHHLPAWIPKILRKKIAPQFAAACGQFMAFRRKAYRAIGGHESVKKRVVEDVELAKNIKRAGYSMKMYHGRGTVHCRMYTSSQELWEGFRKNFFAGFGYNLFLFTVMGLLHLITFLLPILLLPILLFWGTTKMLVLNCTILMLIFLQRLIINHWFNWDLRYALLHPLGVGWFQLLGLQALQDYFSDSSASWKERSI
jgi:chlorobactene glucosyltransferase